jgi:SHS2 domain-containing protein
MGKKFEFLDISGDAGLRVFGHTLEEIFVNGATGLYSLITDLSKVAERDSVDVKILGDSLDGLFVGWLNELIFQFDAYSFIGRTVSIDVLDENIIEAKVSGEEFDLEKHERGLLLKAATYHNFKFEKMNGIWTVEVIFDI